MLLWGRVSRLRFGWYVVLRRAKGRGTVDREDNPQKVWDILC